MTQRERQILNWIEENPLISQQELAEKAGITRSSVAVHISNLMKKGYITGKGYIVHTAPYVTVVGGVNMDIGGWPSEVPVDRDSNPGAVRMSLGGVGRNIAHNMSLLGLDVRMVTAFGDDLYAQKIAASCGELGIDISQSPVIPEGHTSTYLFINDEKGDMLLAVSDMDIYRHLTPQLLSQRQKLLSGSQVLVIDTNIPAESIAYLAENCPVPIFADPVSTAKAVKLQPVLGRLHTLKPNRIEAELLSGVAITDEASLRAAADALLATGLHRVFISLGGDGVFAADRSGERVHLPVLPAEMVNTTGCGDAFMAAITWAYLAGTDLTGTAKAGLAASAIAMEGAALNKYLDIAPEVQKALDEGRPVVALESTIISHGMPYPQNVETALNVEKIIREHGATPATIAVIGGRLKAGLSPEEIDYLGKTGPAVAKASRRDLPVLVAEGRDGATTVTTTMIIAHMAGISVFATGGIGGVHRGAETTMDISADLEELAHTPVMVVCAGAKSILDLGLTLEYLETHGVPVIGYGTRELPAFYTRKSGFAVDYEIDTPAELAKAFYVKQDMGLGGGMLVTNPIPEEYSMDADVINKAIDEAVEEAKAQGIHGKETTPFLLAKIKDLTGGDSLASNIQLVYNNAKLAAATAVELSKLAKN